jgi:hypothetical protein
MLLIEAGEAFRTTGPMGIAYMMKVGDRFSAFNTVEQMQEQIAFWKEHHPDLKYSFFCTVHFDCWDIPECKRIFAEYFDTPRV